MPRGPIVCAFKSCFFVNRQGYKDHICNNSGCFSFALTQTQLTYLAPKFNLKLIIPDLVSFA